MTDACCKYCTWLGHAEPKTLTTSWNPLVWRCDQGLTVREGYHHCIAYERHVGTDDDLGDGDLGEIE